MASAMPIMLGPKTNTSLPQAGVKAQPERLNCLLLSWQSKLLEPQIQPWLHRGRPFSHSGYALGRAVRIFSSRFCGLAEAGPFAMGIYLHGSIFMFDR